MYGTYSDITALDTIEEEDSDYVDSGTVRYNLWYFITMALVWCDSVLPQPRDSVPPQPRDSVPPQPRDYVPPQPRDSVPPQPRDSVPPQPRDSVSLQPRDSKYPIKEENVNVSNELWSWWK